MGRTNICIIVENETVPFDRRVWLEACTLNSAGYGVSVICPKRQPFKDRRETSDGIEIYRYWSWDSHGLVGHILEYGWSLVAQLYLALRVYAKTRFRILHACNPPDTIFLIGLIFKLWGVRFIFDHHDLSPEMFTVRFGTGATRNPLHWLLCAFERLTFQTADFSLATNESYREIAVTRGGMKPGRVAVVQTCANLEDASRAKKHPQPKKSAQYLVVYVGNMEPQDGVDLLLLSAEYVVKEKHRKDVLFLIIGSGTELPRLRKLASQMDLEGSVRFTGRIQHNEVDSYLSVADVCVAPDPLNALNDCCSMIKIFEYMAHGKPTVLYDLKEGRRSAGKSALYARPNDPLDFGEQVLKLLDSDSLRQELGECGRKCVRERLNWELQSKALLDAYKTVQCDVP